jgi:uncharacterized protein
MNSHRAAFPRPFPLRWPGRALALLAFAVLAIAATPQSLQIPAPVGYVNDFANVIPPNNKATIERIIDDVRAKSGGEIVVVTLPDLKGRPIEEVSLRIGREWKVGQKGNPGDPARNTGVIILVVPKETSSDGQGHVRTEVGYGAEGFITDAQTGQLRDAAIPYFRNRDYGTGIEIMTLGVAQRFANEFNFQVDSTFQQIVPQPRTTSRGGSRGGGIPPIVWLFLLFFILSMLGGRRRGCLPLFIPIGGGRGGWGGGGWGGGGFGGGGGGGFGGFGGGAGFGGGGSSGSW